MTLRRSIAACAAVLLLAGGIAVAWWWLGGETRAPFVAKRGGAAVADGGTRADPRFPPDLSDEPDQAERTEDDGVERTVELGETERRELLVRVVDRERRPVANVPVALGVLGGERPHPFVARSGADGIARLVGFPTPRGPVDADLTRLTRFLLGKWSVHFPFPEAEPTIVPIDLRALPSEPVEIVAPPLGVLVVKLVDGVGRPVATHGIVSIDVKLVGSVRDFPADEALHPLTAPDELRLDPFPAGLDVRAEAIVAEYAWTEVDGAGPRRAGDTATIVVTLGRHGPIVIGELIGADGKPVAGRALEGLVHDDPDLRAASGDGKAATDERGRFRFDASRLELEGAERRRWLDLIARDATLGVTGRARVELPMPFREGEVDVGRVAFEEAPLVVAGRVIDRRNADPAVDSSAPGVRVQVCRPELAANPALRRGAFGDLLQGVTDGHGEFAIHGFVDGAERIVEAADTSDSNFDCIPVRFLPGARDVVLELVQSGSLEGSLRFDPSVDSIHVAVFLRRSGDARGGFAMGVAPSRDGAFRWNRVPAGRVDVAVGLGRYSEQPHVVVVVPDVEVKPGELNHDPRLEGLDLRERIRKARVELVDPDGAPLAGGTVTLLANDETRAPVLTVLVRDGVVELPLLAPTFAVEVRSDGMAVERRSGLVSPARIVMRRGLPVVVVLDPPFPLKEGAPVSLRLVLTKAHPLPGLVSPQQRVALGDGASATIALPEACPMRVDLEANLDFTEATAHLPPDRQREAMERWDQLCADLGRAFGKPVVDVKDDASGQQLRVPLPAAARAVLERMVREFAGD